MRKAVIIVGACVLALGGCAVSRAPEMSPTAVRTAWLSKGRYVWQPLVPAPQHAIVRHAMLERKPATITAPVPRVLACDLTGFNAGCANY